LILVHQFPSLSSRRHGFGLGAAFLQLLTAHGPFEGVRRG
jgi:hypothetical protein